MDMVAMWIPIVAIVASSCMVVLVVSQVTKSRQRRTEVQAEVQTKLIDRFGSAPELIAFLQSPAGRQFVSGVQSAPAAITRERVLSSLTRSIILTALGVAFMFIAIWDHDDGWVVPASIVLFLGLGYFIATIVSYKLSAKMNADASLPPMIRDNNIS